jgi:hypothetical protein
LRKLLKNVKEGRRAEGVTSVLVDVHVYVLHNCFKEEIFFAKKYSNAVWVIAQRQQVQ